MEKTGIKAGNKKRKPQTGRITNAAAHTTSHPYPRAVIPPAPTHPASPQLHRHTVCHQPPLRRQRQPTARRRMRQPRLHQLAHRLRGAARDRARGAGREMRACRRRGRAWGEGGRGRGADACRVWKRQRRDIKTTKERRRAAGGARAPRTGRRPSRPPSPSPGCPATS